MRQIVEAWESYLVTVDAVARALFLRKVVPFCKARGWSFTAGHGVHTFHNPKGGTYLVEQLVDPASHPDDAELQELEQVLTQEVSGLPHNTIGSLMPCYAGEEA